MSYELPHGYKSIRDLREKYVIFYNKKTHKLVRRVEMELTAKSLINDSLENFMETDIFKETFDVMKDPRSELISPLYILKNTEDEDFVAEYIQYLLVQQYECVCEKMYHSMSLERLEEVGYSLLNDLKSHKKFIDSNDASFALDSGSTNFKFRFLSYLDNITSVFKYKFRDTKDNVIATEDYKLETFKYHPFCITLPNGLKIVYTLGLSELPTITDNGYNVYITPKVYRGEHEISCTCRVVSKINRQYLASQFEKLVFYLIWDMNII
jgi:hypothetical protein